MSMVPLELMKCFEMIGRLRRLQANISRDLRDLEREARRLIAESPGLEQVKRSDEIEELEKLWKQKPPARRGRKYPKMP